MSHIDSVQLESDDVPAPLGPKAPQRVPGYTLLDHLGEGGFARVFRARSESTNRVVALKLLQIDSQLDARQRELRRARFWRETALSATLHHPNIVGLIDRGHTVDGELYAAYEFVPGETLRELLFRQETLPAQEAGALLSQVLDALTCAHAKSVIHRDLKPENIMVTRTGAEPQAMVLDFGIGFLTESLANLSEPRLTLTDEVIGTPAYAAPEQLRGEKPTPKSDIYSWGLVFLECLLGESPIHGDTLAEIVRCQLDPNEIPMPPGLLAHPLGTLLRRALRKDPKHRAGSVEALHAELRRINLSALVGRLSNARTSWAPAQPWSQTVDAESGFLPRILEQERRQVTLLCCGLGVSLDALALDPEAFEALQRDVLGRCRDVLDHFGGWIAGALSGRVLACFGYPHASSGDVRRAASAAVELRARILEALAQRGDPSGVAFALALHTGPVIVGRDGLVDGLTQSAAIRLQEGAPHGAIVVSSTAAQLLAQSQDSGFALEPQAQPGAGSFRLVTRAAANDENLSSAPPSELIGRARERSELTRMWRSTEAARAVLLIGEPGVGKSRLAHDLVTFVAEQGGSAQIVRCLPEHANSALYPLLQLLRTSWALPASSSEAALARIEKQLRKLSQDETVAMPILCAWLGLPLPADSGPPRESPHQQKSILFAILMRALALDAATTLLAIEDLHWADPTTLEFVTQLSREREPGRAMLLLTARPEFAPRWDATLTTRMTLSGLATEEIGELARSLLSRPLTRAALSAVRERTAGIPLFVQELLRMLKDEGLLVAEQGAYGLAAGLDASAIPLTLRDVLSERLDKLGEARETAALCAALGREFSARLLAAASQRTALAVARDLDTLVARGVLEPASAERGDEKSFAFRHALIRDVIYDLALPSVRERLHAHIAEVLLGDFPELARERAAELARHFALGRRFDAAVDYGTRAARSALARAANAEAAAHATQVLAWATELSAARQPSAQLAANGVLTQALMAIRGWADPEVQRRVELSTRLLEREPDRELELATRWALMTYHYVAANRRELRQLVADALGSDANSADASFRVFAQTFSGLLEHGAGNYELAARELTLALELYDKERHQRYAIDFGIDAKVWCSATLALVRWFQARPSEAFSLADEAVAFASELDHMPSLGIALLYSANLQHYARKKDSVLELCARLEELDRNFGYPAYAAYGGILRAWALSDPERGAAIVEQLESMGCNAALSYYSSLRAEVLAQAGQHAAALRQLDASLALCERHDELYYQPELLCLRASWLAELGQLAAAEREWRRALADAERLGMTSSAQRARAALVTLATSSSG